jgi:ligand-binding sensor domain-containing protein
LQADDANGGAFTPLAAGEDVVTGVAQGGVFLALDDDGQAVRAFAPGRVRDDVLPFPARRLLAFAGVLFADTTDGLYRRDADGWRLAAPRPSALPPGPAHVTALAFLGSELVAGLFDGGLVTAQAVDGALRWRGVRGTAAWGVNALLPAGGALYVASLRGAARFDGRSLTPLDGPGAAFSLAATTDGVAIGYGQGVLLPGTRLLSAFHGLPGNQALALLEGDVLFVGTPSGLGAVGDRKVRFRMAGGEGRLPHPWVTALALSRGGLYVGTYGGGIVRRTASGVDAPVGRVDHSRYEPFVETEGLKINAGCLVEAGGRLYAGTDGKGLYRLSADARAFEPVAASLPSRRITALLSVPGALYVGTDEGVARLPLSGTGGTGRE